DRVRARFRRAVRSGVVEHRSLSARLQYVRGIALSVGARLRGEDPAVVANGDVGGVDVSHCVRVSEKSVVLEIGDPARKIAHLLLEPLKGEGLLELSVVVQIRVVSRVRRGGRRSRRGGGV